MATSVEEMTRELKDLNGKIDKLSDEYMNHTSAYCIDERDLMYCQLSVMKAYLDILNKRIFRAMHRSTRNLMAEAEANLRK